MHPATVMAATMLGATKRAVRQGVSVQPLVGRMALDAAQTDTANRVIQALAGPTAHLRDDQLAAVEQLVTPAARVLVVQATGWGKSAVYG